MGELLTFGNKLLLIDYAHNQTFHVSSETENKIRPVLFHYPTNNLYYCADSVLYFGNIEENRLESLVLHRNDFVLSDDEVYTSGSAVAMTLVSAGNGGSVSFRSWSGCYQET